MSKRKDLVRGVLRFDPSVTKQQRDAMAVIVPILFPGKWKSFVLESDSVLEWKYTKDRGEARLDGGKTCRSRPSVLLARGTGFFVFRLSSHGQLGWQISLSLSSLLKLLGRTENQLFATSAA